MAFSCSYCYAQCEARCNSVTCTNCWVRKYCSVKCRRADARCGHARWCGKAGEMSKDYEVRATNDNGSAVFALRKFKFGEVVMVERVTFQFKTSSPDKEFEPVNLAQFVVAPDNIREDLSEPSVVNSFTMTKINHHCLGNTEAMLIKSQGVRILKALRAINAGEELTYSAIDCRLHDATEIMREIRNVPCPCSACNNKDTKVQLRVAKGLHDELVRCVQLRQYDTAMALGDKLLSVCAELKLGYQLDLRTYYSLFQIAIVRRITLVQALYYIQRLLETLNKIYGDLELPELVYYKLLARDVTTHPLYGAADRKV